MLVLELYSRTLHLFGVLEYNSRTNIVAIPASTINHEPLTILPHSPC